MIDRYGPEGSQLVIALHGSPANRKAWLGLVPHLPPDVRLIAPDLPGHGSLRDGRFSVEAALAGITSTIAAEGATSAIVAGDSLGGYLALAAGSRCPGVGAVVAGGCTFEMRGIASALASASDLPLRLGLRLFGARRLESIAGRLLPRLIDPQIAREIAIAGVELRARGDSIRALSRLRTESLVAACPVPIVFVNGGNDWPTRSGERRFVALARSAALVVAPGAPHGVSQFKPEIFALAIARAREMLQT